MFDRHTYALQTAHRYKQKRHPLAMPAEMSLLHVDVLTSALDLSCYDVRVYLMIVYLISDMHRTKSCGVPTVMVTRKVHVARLCNGSLYS